ncbi:MAG: hypothetical protein HOY76_19285 [Streptomyces sp.]|nr:hypothetical protein [Streptomyces sp.]NUS11586.1 hypothetical protein [Streptomyces sp.]
MASPRPYVVAAAASVLAALYFVPSASAAGEHAPSAAHAAPVSAQSAKDGDLADTGSIDTKPYLVGGSAFLVLGAGLLVDAARRARQADGAAV